jgi:hypothetical protein
MRKIFVFITLVLAASGFAAERLRPPTQIEVFIGAAAGISSFDSISDDSDLATDWAVCAGVFYVSRYFAYGVQAGAYSFLSTPAVPIMAVFGLNDFIYFKAGILLSGLPVFGVQYDLLAVRLAKIKVKIVAEVISSNIGVVFGGIRLDASFLIGRSSGQARYAITNIIGMPIF